MHRPISLLLLFFAPFLGIRAQTAETVTDNRDGKVYRTVTIGTQTWMAENLNFESRHSHCYDCELYGRMYMYDEALTSCPDGWHLPSEGDWTTLIAYLGGYMEAGGKLKEAGFAHWRSPNTSATNSSGFNAIPNGYRSFNGVLNFERKRGYWWTSTPNSLMSAWSIVMLHNKGEVARVLSDKPVGLSVRCLRNP
jgi:uncharacterized protein (TIGR02145 family)